MTSERRVIPLESNPDIFNTLLFNLGLLPILQFQDLYLITDPDLLAFAPNPIYGLILLFPLTKNYENYRKSTDEHIPPTANENIGNVKWFKQTIGNACGLYALLHILGNLPRDFVINLLQLNDFLRQITNQSSVEDVSRLVEALETEIKLDTNYGQQGQTTAPSADEQINLHFILYVKAKDGHVYELDGRRKGPIDLGPLDSQHLLDSNAVIDKLKFYMDNADEENKHNFSIMALGPESL